MGDRDGGGAGAGYRERAYSRLVIDDIVYGRGVIDDPVLLDLLAHPGFLRSRGLDQFGPPRDWWWCDGFSRYDHGVGAMLLVRRCGGSLEEQAAALLHDASNRAFSHVYDWVFGRKHDEGGQDEDHHHQLSRLGLSGVLASHGLDPAVVADVKRFPLLERPAPALCADRIDYSLRELAVTMGEPAYAGKLADALVNVGGRLVFEERTSAREFASVFLGQNSANWSSPQSIVRYHLLAEAISESSRHGLFCADDMLQDNAYAQSRLRAASAELGRRGLSYVADRLDLLERGFELIDDPDGIELNCKKFRFVDPAFLEAGVVVVLSEADSIFVEMLDGAREHHLSSRRVRPVSRGHRRETLI